MLIYTNPLPKLPLRFARGAPFQALAGNSVLLALNDKG